MNHGQLIVQLWENKLKCPRENMEIELQAPVCDQLALSNVIGYK